MLGDRMSYQNIPPFVTVYRTPTFVMSVRDQGLDDEEADDVVANVAKHYRAGRLSHVQMGMTLRRLSWKDSHEVTYMHDDCGRIYLLVFATADDTPPPPARRARLQAFLDKLWLYGLFEGVKWLAGHWFKSLDTRVRKPQILQRPNPSLKQWSAAIETVEGSFGQLISNVRPNPSPMQQPATTETVEVFYGQLSSNVRPHAGNDK
jgi:hypothetical protein